MKHRLCDKNQWQHTPLFRRSTIKPKWNIYVWCRKWCLDKNERFVWWTFISWMREHWRTGRIKEIWEIIEALPLHQTQCDKSNGVEVCLFNISLILESGRLWKQTCHSCRIRIFTKCREVQCSCGQLDIWKWPALFVELWWQRSIWGHICFGRWENW